MLYEVQDSIQASKLPPFPVLDELQRDVVALRPPAVQDDAVLVVGLEAQPHRVAQGGHGVSGEEEGGGGEMEG